MNQDIKVTVDSVVFRSHPGNKFSVLLIKRKNPPFKNKWALPGGFVENHEEIKNAAQRELKEETGIKTDQLKQFYTFGTPDRDPRSRTISIAHYCILDSGNNDIPKADSDANKASWFKLDDLPELAFDHQEILKLAISKIR